MLFDNGLRIECGNVAILPNQIVPLKDAVVEVRYLYAMPKSHALFQPVYLGVRQDIPETECVLEQMEYKAA